MNKIDILPNSLESIKSQCPGIELVKEQKDRPLWSVMIPTYNRTKYLERTLKSLLNQALAPEVMQIEVVDNCSTEVDMEAVVKDIGQGRISFYRQPYNVSLTANLTACIQRSRGYLVHILHDDDVVLPGFYQHLQEAFEKEPTIGAAFCRYANIDENDRPVYIPKLEQSTAGIISNWIERIAVEPLIQPPALVVKRSVYENIGGFHPELRYTCDWEMCKRIAAYYPVWYEPQILAYYRIHSASATSDVIKSGANVADRRKAIEISRAYLPSPLADQLSHKAEEVSAINTLGAARRALSRGDTATTIVQIKQALKCSSSPKIVAVLTLVPILAGIERMKQYSYKRAY
ncbi:glycosyl transferase family 2 [Gloeocapsa sp. PCC 7428]|uniref:glycosyltransferase family 2 protein n=1 Tax=Gloeocapsa sp. PCC 7428 TaxID=1173026 RepID=UPI0002A61D1D|nr:glycosyltransferase [Gloeocapsa sp. PCC 7428]AFZ31384.1 glycosyl transferase family 2 [Gloeocapsa sp. PCC 7428]